ncbi:Nuclear cap-binding protein subunit 1 [Knufia peltigerae]|uniref:Nuclear cap-binding protein subunit 1 n=1 Tax=Knufia peltigerae TaxID=1002370 RepID=A0AA39CL12_9EURO|nr:Nuclear cap-binding protein subunit 1 [Knufia peltigerae]
MADYDRRPRRGGGGGGGGHFNNRKRRYRDDDFEDRRPQRRRYEEPLAVTVRKQVLSIAESPVRKAEEDVATIAKTLADNYFDNEVSTSFVDLVTQMVIEQPLKTPFLAAIVYLTNAQKPELVTDVLRKISEALQKRLDLGLWREAKLYLRFLGCLQGIFSEGGVFTILEELFSKAADLQMKSSEDSLGLEIVKIILLTIPYAMSSSATGLEAQALSLLEKTDIIASTAHPLEVIVDPYPSPEAGAPTSSESALALLQKHMQEESRNGWELACLPRPWKGDRSSEEEEALAAAQTHQFPAIKIPEEVQIGPRSIFPEVYFSVYGEQDIETVPRPSDSASILIRDALSDTINGLDFNRMAAARFLIDVDCYFAPGTFVKRATQFDKLREVAGDKATWKPEDVIVDACFSQLMQLPAPEHKLIYYHSVLTEACKLAPAAVAPSLGRAIRFLYRNVDRMDFELSQRFLDWFAHHLSNFGFTWKWTEWVDDVQLLNVHPKKAFIIDALDKEIRLSFSKRIKNTLPEPYQALISEEKEKDSPDFKYNDDSTPFATQGKAIAQLVRTKAANEEFSPLLETIEQEAMASGMADPELASTDAFVTSICWIGSKSLSHVLACIERCKERLLAISSKSPACRKQIMTSVMNYWKSQTGVGVIILDKLLNYQILTPSSIVEWALVDHVARGTLLASAWCYELVEKTTKKVGSRVHSIVHAIRQLGLTDDQKSELQQTLTKELESMKTLYESIQDAVVSIRDGNQDEMMESSDALRAEDEELLKSWGGKWAKTFQRKCAVEENWVREELARPIPEPEVKEQTMTMDSVDSGLNGAGENGNADADVDGIE